MTIRVAAGPYAHLAALEEANGRDGLEVRLEVREPGKIFPEMLREAPWHVAEMSLATAWLLAAKDDRRFAVLPVFPSRTFRHSALYVPAASPARGPEDLRGKRIGVLRYAMTTAVWVRQLFASQYRLGAGDFTWYVGEESAHPAAVRPEVVNGAEALERMAVEGRIDCLISGRSPRAFARGELRRLFADFGAWERAYFAASGVFPIMHVMVARRDFAQAQPEALSRLLRRFEDAKALAEKRLVDADLSVYPLPWLPAYVEEAQRLTRGELWPYGIEANRPTLDAFGKAMHDEGLAPRVLAPEEVFHAAA